MNIIKARICGLPVICKIITLCYNNINNNRKIMKHVSTLLKTSFAYLITLLKYTYAVALTAGAAIAAYKLYEAYLKIKVLGFEYNVLYSVLILSAVAYLILYFFYVAYQIRSHCKKSKKASGVIVNG